MMKPNDTLLHRRKPTEQELAQAAVITQADVDLAIAAFNQYAPTAGKGLLDARVEEEGK